MTRADPCEAGPNQPSVTFPVLGVARAVLRPRSALVHGQAVLQFRHNGVSIGAQKGSTPFSTIGRSHAALQASQGSSVGLV